MWQTKCWRLGWALINGKEGMEAEKRKWDWLFDDNAEMVPETETRRQLQAHMRQIARTMTNEEFQQWQTEYKRLLNAVIEEDLAPSPPAV